MCNNTEAMKRAVIDGHGITIISELLVKKELTEGRLYKVDISGEPIKRKLCLVYHKNKYFFEALKNFTRVCEDYQKS